LRDADLVVLHSGFTLHNVVAARIARRRVSPTSWRLGVPTIPHIFLRRRLLKELWWRAFEYPMVKRARAVHLFFTDETADLERLGYHGPTLVAPNGVEPPRACNGMVGPADTCCGSAASTRSTRVSTCWSARSRSCRRDAADAPPGRTRLAGRPERITALVRDLHLASG
jgi:hypothetical protein